jgi:hypothetical protein
MIGVPTVLVGMAAFPVLAARTSPPERVATPVNPAEVKVNNGDPLIPAASSSAALATVGAASRAVAAMAKYAKFFLKTASYTPILVTLY